jgi:hypothetical protein
MDDTELKALLAMDAPPARDLRFELAVMARIERQAFHRALLRNAGVAALVALVLALVAPSLEAVWQQTVAPTTSNLMLAALLLAATFVWTRFYAGQD